MAEGKGGGPVICAEIEYARGFGCSSDASWFCPQAPCESLRALILEPPRRQTRHAAGPECNSAQPVSSHRNLRSTEQSSSRHNRQVQRDPSTKAGKHSDTHYAQDEFGDEQHDRHGAGDPGEDGDDEEDLRNQLVAGVEAVGVAGVEYTASAGTVCNTHGLRGREETDREDAPYSRKRLIKAGA